MPTANHAQYRHVDHSDSHAQDGSSSSRGGVTRGLIFDANVWQNWLTIGCKSTAIAFGAERTRHCALRHAGHQLGDRTSRPSSGKRKAEMQSLARNRDWGNVALYSKTQINRTSPLILTPRFPMNLAIQDATPAPDPQDKTQQSIDASAVFWTARLL